MHPYSQVVIIDELSLSDGDHKKINAGQTSEVEETLTWLAENTAMTLAALSSTSLLDRFTNSPGSWSWSESEFNKMITRTGFNAVGLSNIMRSSQNIAAATSTANVSETLVTQFNLKIKETISPGSSSTVPGNRPKAMLYKDTGYLNHSKLAEYVSKHLSTLPPSRIKVAVLCLWEISARKISCLLSRDGFKKSR